MKRENTHGNRQVITTSQLGDLANVTERGTHDNRVVAVLLVVIVDAADAQHTRVFLRGVILLGGRLEPVEDATDERRDQERTGLGSGNGLDNAEHESQIAVDAVLRLEYVSGLDTLPRRGDLDEDTILGDAQGFEELEREETVSEAAGKGKGKKAG